MPRRVRVKLEAQLSVLPILYDRLGISKYCGRPIKDCGLPDYVTNMLLPLPCEPYLRNDPLRCLAPFLRQWLQRWK